MSKRSGFSGVRLLQALTGIVLLAVAAPPGFAILVNRSRVDQARQEVHRLADTLQVAGLIARPGGQWAGGLLGGPGNTPEAPGVSQWVDGRVASLGDYVSQSLRSDPWGNQYLVNVGLPRGGDAEGGTAPHALWVLSAGPNGIVETPYAMLTVSAVVGGDDVAARIAQ